MSHQLELVLHDLPNDIHQAVLALGVTSVGDFRYMWSSAQECYSELERKVGRQLPGHEAMAIAVAWTNARRASIKQTDALSLEIAQVRNSSVGVPTRGFEAPASQETSSEPASKMRRLVPSGVPAERAPLLTAAVSSDVFAKEDATKAAKLDQLFNLVLEHVLNLEELGVSQAQLQDPMELQRLKSTTMAGASRLSSQRLSALASALRRWLRFCAAREADHRQPSPLLLADFLREVSAGGPTAAASMHASLKWYAASFGAHFPMDHWATKHFRFHAVHHTGRQAPELEPWEFTNLLLLMKRSQGTHRVLVAMMLMAALGCIRFEHLQRSKFVTTHGPSLEFQCAQGKARKKGARPGYNWGLPHATLDGQGVTQTLLDFYANEFPQSSGFLIPAVSLNPEEFWEVTEHTGLIVNKAMSRARFLELLRGALYQIGVEFTNAQAAGYNRLRRFIPTVANILELPDLDLQAVGNWTEIPAGGGRDPSAGKPRALLSMGVHYAGSKVLRSLQVKQRCVNRFMNLFHRKRRELALTEDGFLCRDAWLWPELAAAHKLVPEDTTAIEKELSEAIEVAPGALPVEEEVPAGSGLPTTETSSSSSEDDSSSASDVSAEGGDLDGVMADEMAAEEILWFIQGKKTHLIREEMEGRPTPWCRDFPFVQEPQSRGRGCSGTNRSSFCERCLSRMPRGLYMALAEYNSWVI